VKMMPILLAAGALLSGCVNPDVKFKKAQILDPLMDPAKDPGLAGATLGEPARLNEKGASGSGASAGTSCPTCGK
jgi:hypothetical protein